MEDATSLGALLPAGTPTQDIPERLKLYNECRYTRAHEIQEYTRLAGRDAHEFKAEDKQLNSKPPVERNLMLLLRACCTDSSVVHEYTAYNFGHDEWDASTHVLQRHLALRDTTSRFRTPCRFGPSPGPRLPLCLDPSSPTIQSLRQECPESFRTLSVRFRSSRTFLQNLLPPGFAFTSPATNVSASISCTTLYGLTWLGGRGYNHLGLYLHGVHYTKEDGSKVFGTYIAVLFEDLADPIMTGRDELGFPKVFADIDIDTSGNAGDYNISLGWSGAQFGKVAIKGLREREPAANGINGGSSQTAKPAPGPPPPPPDQGHLVFRYVPAVGEFGKTDARYAVLCPYPENSEPSEKMESDSASVSFEALDWQRLPTLHHIAKTLAAMPIYGVEKAEMSKGTQVDHLSGARRIE